MDNPQGIHHKCYAKQHLVFSLYQFSAKQIAHSFDTSAMRMEHSGIYKQDIHNDLRYFTPNIFLNFIPDKKRIHPSKADAPTLQSKNLPNTSALYCGRKIFLSILCLIKGLDVKRQPFLPGILMLWFIDGQNHFMEKDSQ